ncbi:hypothetical protein MHYP_G00074400 [Metynnis hypsauchen]
MHGISRLELTKLMATAKEECIIHKLADLRARGPEPPVVSELDLDNATYAKPRSIIPLPKGRTPEVPCCFNRTMVGQALQDYQEFHTVSEPMRKDRENTKLHKSHATRFVLHMHQKCHYNRFENMKFIYNFHQIWQWPVVLLSQKYTTSIKNMMLNASGFIAPVKAFHSETSGLTNVQFDRILLQFKKLQKDNSRRIKAHQQTVKTAQAKQRLWNLHAHCQGYLAGYLGILTGHHPVVLTNLQKDKVLQTEVDDDNRAFVWVDHHKTDQTFGNAYMALLPHEVDWLKGLIEVSIAHFGGEQCPFVFQFEGKQLYKLNSELKAAWHHSGMQGQISFGLIWTAIANQVGLLAVHDVSPRANPFSLCVCRQRSTYRQRSGSLCEAMCHDVSTADHFYTSVPEIGDVFRIRALRMKAVEHDNSMEPDIQSTDNEAGLTATSDSDDEA